MNRKMFVNTLAEMILDEVYNEIDETTKEIDSEIDLSDFALRIVEKIDDRFDLFVSYEKVQSTTSLLEFWNQTKRNRL